MAPTSSVGSAAQSLVPSSVQGDDDDAVAAITRKQEKEGTSADDFRLHNKMRRRSVGAEDDPLRYGSTTVTGYYAAHQGSTYHENVRAFSSLARRDDLAMSDTERTRFERILAEEADKKTSVERLKNQLSVDQVKVQNRKETEMEQARLRVDVARRKKEKGVVIRTRARSFATHLAQAANGEQRYSLRQSKQAVKKAVMQRHAQQRRKNRSSLETISRHRTVDMYRKQVAMIRDVKDQRKKIAQSRQEVLEEKKKSAMRVLQQRKIASAARMQYLLSGGQADSRSGYVPLGSRAAQEANVSGTYGAFDFASVMTYQDEHETRGKQLHTSTVEEMAQAASIA